MRRAGWIIALMLILPLLAVFVFLSGGELAVLYMMTIGGVGEGEPLFMDPAPPLAGAIWASCFFVGGVVILMWCWKRARRALSELSGQART
jgi:hypothetical protein